MGRAAAHQFAYYEAKAVFICDYKIDYLETHKREMNVLYPNVKVHPKQFDAADEAGVKDVVEEAIRLYGRLDVFFANAAVGGTWKTVFDTTVAEFESTMRTNLARYDLFKNTTCQYMTAAVCFLPPNMLALPCK